MQDQESLVVSEETLDLKISLTEDPLWSPSLKKIFENWGAVGSTSTQNLYSDADKPGCWVSLIVDGHLADRCRQVRTDADNPGFRVSLLVGGQVRIGADRCGQPWLLGVSLSCRTFGRQVRIGADRCEQPWFLGVS